MATLYLTRRAGSVAVVLVSLFASLARAGDLDNIGSHFLIAAPANLGGADLKLHLTAQTASNITIEYPSLSPTFTWTGSLAAGASTDVSVGYLPTIWTADAVQDNAVRVRSSSSAEQFSVCASTKDFYSVDTSVALPIDSLGLEYIAVDYDRLASTNVAEFVVWGTQDGTTVSITPSVLLFGPHPAGVTYTVLLNDGDCYEGRTGSGNAPDSLTGTIISADKPVGFVSGANEVNIPVGTTWSDAIFEFGLPVEHWGQSYVLANLPLRPDGSIYRVVGSQNGTAWKLDGVAQAPIQRGQFVELGPLVGDHLLSAEQPLLVAQYMTGMASVGAVNGDPAMCILPAWTQHRAQHRFVVPNVLFFDEPEAYYATIIARAADVGLLTLDNAVVTGFTQVGSSDFWVARELVSIGAHITQSGGDNVHGVTVEGYVQYESFEHAAGVQFLDSTTGSPCSTATNTWSDDFDSYVSGSSINGQGGWLNGPGTMNPNLVSSSFSRSGSNSLQLQHFGDMAQQFSGVTSGKWTFRAYQYLPTPFGPPPYFLQNAQFELHSRYNNLGLKDPSVLIVFGVIPNVWTMAAGANGPVSGALIYDQWVEIRCDIDLDADTVDVFYGGDRMAPTYAWSTGAFGQSTGVAELAAVELSMIPADPNSYAFYDCMSLDLGGPAGSTVDINIVVGTGAEPLMVDTKSAGVDSGDVVSFHLPNALAHSCDNASLTATSLFLSFVNENPTDGAWKRSAPVQPLGGAGTHLYAELSDPLASGAYVYTLQILDQFGDLLCTIDPELVAAPTVTAYCTPSVSTNGCMASMSAVGTPSVSTSSGFTLTASNVEGGRAGLIFYGISGRAASTWAAGSTSVLCVKAPTQRMGTQFSGGFSGSCAGVLTEDWLAYTSGHPAALGSPFAGGNIVNAQAWFRDPAAPKTTNLSDALEFTLEP